MAKIGNLKIKGASGTTYTFNVYPYDTEFKDLAAVYYISNRIEENDGKGSHSPIYIGQTEDLSTRFDGHHDEECFEEYGANCKNILPEANEEKRKEIEADLISSLNPPCNN